MEPVPPRVPERAPSIRDVARRAGVGVGTVSRVINGSPQVSASTNARVRSAIADLGYSANRRARSLALGRSQVVGVVAPFFTSPSVVERLRGVAQRLADHGYDLLLFDVENARQRADAFERFARRDAVDGLLVISLPLSERELETVRGEGLPLVLVDVATSRFPHVGIDDRLGGSLAAAHLLEREHRRIGFVGDDPLNPHGFTSSERRREGFLAALADAGVEPDEVPVALGRHGREPARALADRLLGLERPPTAIFAASDVQAVGVLDAAAGRGLRVPDDVAVLGFDDIEMASALGLSTIRQPLLRTGAIGADLLVAAMGGVEPAPAAGDGLEPLRVVARRTT